MQTAPAPYPAERQAEIMSPATASEIAVRAKQWYNAGIRRRLETRANLGKHLVIDPQTGRWIMGDDPDGDDDLEVSRRAIESFGTHHLYGMRIGYPASEALGISLEPFAHLLGDEPGEAEEQ